MNNIKFGFVLILITGAVLAMSTFIVHEREIAINSLASLISQTRQINIPHNHLAIRTPRNDNFKAIQAFSATITRYADSGW